jgi:hypothetical protein
MNGFVKIEDLFIMVIYQGKRKYLQENLWNQVAPGRNNWYNVIGW